MTRFDFVGLDGANPLGFLAAIGTLRTATARWKDHSPKMGWSQSSGGWRPYLEVDNELSEEGLIDGLHSELQKMKDHPAFKFADNLPINANDYRGVLVKEVLDSDERALPDFWAAFGSEIVVDDKGRMGDTAFRCIGAAKQLLFPTIRMLINETDTHHLEDALLKPWAYKDGKPSMRWDPNDDRRYALRWWNPSPDPIKTVRGANRLAIEGLPLLPTIPVGRRLETTGFTQKRGLGVIWSWPIWEPAVSVEVIRSLLALDELQAAKPDRCVLAARGIVEVFRCQRITEGKYRNFTPAVPA